VTVLDNFVRGVPPWLAALEQHPHLRLRKHDITHPFPLDLGDVEYLVMATECGNIKRTRLDAYNNIYSRGIIAIRLREGDKLTHVRQCNETDRILMVSQKGMSVQFDVATVTTTGRDTQGVRGMKLAAGDRMVGMEVIHDPTLTILTVTKNGFGKRTLIDDHRLQGRGGKGVITIKTTPRNGPVIDARQVRETDDLVMITDRGRVIRSHISDLSVIGRNTQGVRLMRLDEGERVAATTILPERDEEEGATEVPPVDDEVLAADAEDEALEDEGDEGDSDEGAEDEPSEETDEEDEEPEPK
jgi:DNA gyrase subunit A